MEKHIFKSVLVVALLLVCGNAWGAGVKVLTFALNQRPEGWPTENHTTLTNYTYSLDGTAYTFGLMNVKCNVDYLMLSQPAVLGLPAIEGYKLTKVVVSNSSGCSVTTKVGVSSSSSSAKYITGGEAQTWATKGSSYTYNLSGTAANTVYYLYVTDANAQIISLELTYTLDGYTPSSYTVTYNSLGAEVGSETVDEGECCKNIPAVIDAPEGWTFAGWTTQNDYTVCAAAPAMFLATTPVTSDLALYAVFAKIVGGGVPTLTEMQSTDTFVAGDKVVIVARYKDKKMAKGLYQETVSNSYVEAFDFDGKVESIAADDKTWWTVSAGTTEDTWILGDATNGYLYNSGSNDLSVDTGCASNWTLSYDNDQKGFTLRNGDRWLSNRDDLSTNQYKWRGERTDRKPEGHASLVIYKFDPSSAMITYTITAPQTQDITISSVGWVTACVPFTATVSGATAYTAKVEDDALVMTPITVIPAGTGVLLKSVNGDETTATFTESGLEGDDVNGNQLRGNDTDAAVAWGNEEGATDIFTYYIFANDEEDGLGFYWQKDTGGNSVTCGAYKAALVVPGAPATESGAMGYRINGTTMVEELLQENNDATIYDLLGRKVKNAARGLYIVGGKKVMVK